MPTPRRPPRGLAPPCVLALVLLAGSSGLTAQPPERSGAAPTPAAEPDVPPAEQGDIVSPEPTDEPPASLAPSAGGLRVFVDPATGALVTTPRPEQVRALEALELERVASQTRSGTGDRPIRLFVVPGVPGGIGADVSGHFLSSTVLRLHPDGSFDTVCVDHPEETLPHHHAPSPTSAPAPVEDR